MKSTKRSLREYLSEKSPWDINSLIFKYFLLSIIVFSSVNTKINIKGYNKNIELNTGQENKQYIEKSQVNKNFANLGTNILLMTRNNKILSRQEKVLFLYNGVWFRSSFNPR